jgi:hypothetical protein
VIQDACLLATEVWRNAVWERLACCFLGFIGLYRWLAQNPGSIWSPLWNEWESQQTCGLSAW